MSEYHVTRITTVLDDTFSSLIDMSDWAARQPQERRQALLSRALAALCIKSIGGTNDKTAAEAVVDGFDDGGIDALYFEFESSRRRH